MTDTTMDQTSKDTKEAEEAAQLSKALRLGFVIGTPITFVVFFLIVHFGANVDLGASLITAIWVAIVGGGFYGGITGLLTVLNKHDH